MIVIKLSEENPVLVAEQMAVPTPRAENDTMYHMIGLYFMIIHLLLLYI